MKFLTAILFLVFAVSANAQEAVPIADDEKKVLVSQAFVDDANKAFTEVVALRNEGAKKDAALKKLEERIIELTASEALKTGRLIELEKQAVRDNAALEQFRLLRRNKCFGICVQ